MEGKKFKKSYSLCQSCKHYWKNEYSMTNKDSEITGNYTQHFCDKMNNMPLMATPVLDSKYLEPSVYECDRHEKE